MVSAYVPSSLRRHALFEISRYISKRACLRRYVGGSLEAYKERTPARARVLGGTGGEEKVEMERVSESTMRSWSAGERLWRQRVGSPRVIRYSAIRPDLSISMWNGQVQLFHSKTTFSSRAWLMKSFCSKMAGLYTPKSPLSP
jgi:hypothetical protein